MTDREKLIERLDKITRVYRLDAWENTDKIADHLIANGVTVQKWIPASEPPITRGEYLVMIEGAEKATTLWYFPSRKTWEDEAYSTPYPVTHWQPMPEPPKGE